MNLFETLMLAVALAMDCFSVSVTCGIIQRRMGRQVWTMALLFGAFQALMPLIGWGLAAICREEIEAYDHWIAFALLAILGYRMIREGLRQEDTPSIDPSRLEVMLSLAVGTSIDAMSVGFSFTGMGITRQGQLIEPLAVIGAMSFVLTLVGKYLGVRIGRRFRFPAEPVGGVILILIGVKVLLAHLFGL